MSELPSDAQRLHGGMKAQPAVYFLMQSGVCVYVGQTNNVFRRLGSHTTKKEYDDVFVISVDENSLDSVEREWIEKLQPKNNVMGRTAKFANRKKTPRKPRKDRRRGNGYVYFPEGDVLLVENERPCEPYVEPEIFPVDPDAIYEPGGTGLSGCSDQKFRVLVP